tara:strand:+ start:502 stop:1065 length:564 start_codon:yes stop_codon:yes gene_type:complete
MDTSFYIKYFDNLFLAGDPQGSKFYFSKCGNRGNVLKQGDKSYPGFSLGLVFTRQFGHPLKLSCISKIPKNANLLKQGMKLINSYDPSFECTSIQFNKNYQIAKHIDGRNVGDSYIIGLGDYSGGELIVYNSKDEATYIDINHKFYKFNGSKYYHEVSEFIGDRITLVFFRLSEDNKIPEHQKSKKY